jgi:hypothetical protein
MQRLFPAAALLLAACASTPPPPVEKPTVPVAVPTKPERGELIGLSSNELVARLGTPRIQVREGDGTRLQFTSAACVLDAYLYPGSGGVPRVSHVEARTRDGRGATQESCLATIER